jgi:D-sedoheptulose 7-phosphate isomerase
MKAPGTLSKHGSRGGPLERQAAASLRAASSTIARLERTGMRAIAAAAEAMIACLENGGTVFFCGNGGSAADAEHLACELSGRYLMDRPGLAAVALTANTSSLTAIGNDFGFEHVFARALEGLGAPGDVLVAMSTSGRSRNVRRAVDVARGLGMVVVGLTGPGGSEFAARCDVAIVSQHTSTPRIQEAHIVAGHITCELVERALFPPGSAKRPRRRRGRS